VNRRRRSFRGEEFGWALNRLGVLLLRERKLAEAEETFRQLLVIVDKDDHHVLRVRENLASVLYHQEKLSEAEATLRAALAARNAMATTNEVLADGASACLNDLVHVQLAQGKVAEAQTTLGEAHAAEMKKNARLVANGSHMGLATMAWYLATFPDPALRDGKRAVSFAEKAAAATNRKAEYVLDTLAAAYAEVGEFTKAIAVQQEALGIVRDEFTKIDYASRLKFYAANVPFRDINYDELNVRACILQEHGFSQEAEKMLRDALDITPGSVNEEDPRVANGFYYLGKLLETEKRLAEAEGAFRRSRLLGEKALVNVHPVVADSCISLAGVLQDEGRLTEAENMLRKAFTILLRPPANNLSLEMPVFGVIRQHLADSKTHLKGTVERLVQLYEATGRPEQAAEWKQKLEAFGQSPTATNSAVETKPK
jgi:tetratricopeptide (TPR) repeat protein